MRHLLRTIIFAILIVGVITKIEISVSTNETNNENNTISLNENPIVTDLDEHNSLDENPIITVLLQIANLMGHLVGIFYITLAIMICWCLWFCIGACFIKFRPRLRDFFARPTVERPARAPEMGNVYSPQREEEIHNVPPNVIETHF